MKAQNMSFIEINNIENYGKPNGSFDWLKPLAGVIVGYLLSVITAWRLRVKERNKVGKIFEYELKSFKESIKTQVKAVSDYKTKVLNNEYGVIIIYLKHRFDLIKALDRLTLIKYFEKSLKEQSSSWISKIYNNIEILNSETIQLEESYREFQIVINTFLTNYREILNSIRRETAIYSDGLTKDEYDNDKIITKFHELNIKYIDNKLLDLKYIIPLKETFHKELQNDLPIIHIHPFYSKIQFFNFKSRDLIGLIEVKINQHINLLKRFEESIKEKYQIIYGEEIKEVN